jgi:P pilus assembly chaperone PapD
MRSKVKLVKDRPAMDYRSLINKFIQPVSAIFQKSLLVSLLQTLSFSRWLKFASVFTLLCLQVLATNVSLAASQIMVTPTRIVFDAKARSQTVTVINSGNEEGTYRILLVNKRMLPDGNIVNIKTAQSDEQFADKMIRYSPRQVTLKPGQSQVVRLSLRKPRDLKDGEYRSHMTFKALPNKKKGVDISTIGKNSNDIGVTLKAIISVTIPVIMRHGKTESSVSIDSLKVSPPSKKSPRPMLSMELLRQGTQSVYGDFVAELESNGKSTIVGRINGIAVYTPNQSRSIKLPLTLPKGIKLNGVLKVYFRTRAKRGSAILAQSLIDVAQ